MGSAEKYKSDLHYCNKQNLSTILNHQTNRAGTGLSLSYDIITKGHCRELKIEMEDKGKSFFIKCVVNQ